MFSAPMSCAIILPCETLGCESASLIKTVIDFPLLDQHVTSILSVLMALEILQTIESLGAIGRITFEPPAMSFDMFAGNEVALVM